MLEKKNTQKLECRQFNLNSDIWDIKNPINLIISSKSEYSKDKVKRTMTKSHTAIKAVV